MTAISEAHSQQAQNLKHFHLIDFVNWNNNDMDIMRAYHSADVAVDMIGIHSDGIDPHVAALTGMLDNNAAKIVQHDPSLAQGEWTAVVGVTANGNMATVGRWKDGALVEEHLFVRPLKAEEIAAVDVTSPIVTITTPDDEVLRAKTGAEPGWSAVMVDGHVVLTRSVDGETTGTLGSASM